MKQISKHTSKHSTGIMNAVNALAAELDTFVVKSWAMFAGAIQIDVNGNDCSLTVWTDGNDYFATPDWMLDWVDGEWSGHSANGQWFTINNCEPMVVAE